jgi:peptidyl-prolyl cis-trans isomerase A (cyclophilin A)
MRKPPWFACTRPRGRSTALLGGEAPLTVANFLAYVRGGDYASVMFHRSAWVQLPSPAPFVIQAGGYRWPESGCCSIVSSRGTVPNEFSAARSNLRGTVAMAKSAGDPNSATSQWFSNMNDNSANLDSQNGGFTVFGRVTAPGMAVADRIAALPRVNASGTPFSELPVAGWQSGTPIQRSNVVLITGVTEFPLTQSSSDRILNYLEAAFPQYLSPSRGSGGEALGYVYRYYSGSNAYVGTKEGTVWYLVPAISADINALGSVTDWLGAAQAAGY